VDGARGGARDGLHSHGRRKHSNVRATHCQPHLVARRLRAIKAHNAPETAVEIYYHVWYNDSVRSLHVTLSR